MKFNTQLASNPLLAMAVCLFVSLLIGPINAQDRGDFGVDTPNFGEAKTKSAINDQIKIVKNSFDDCKAINELIDQLKKANDGSTKQTMAAIAMHSYLVTKMGKAFGEAASATRTLEIRLDELNLNNDLRIDAFKNRVGELDSELEKLSKKVTVNHSQVFGSHGDQLKMVGLIEWRDEVKEHLKKALNRRNLISAQNQILEQVDERLASFRELATLDLKRAKDALGENSMERESNVLTQHINKINFVFEGFDPQKIWDQKKDFVTPGKNIVPDANSSSESVSASQEEMIRRFLAERSSSAKSRQSP